MDFFLSCACDNSARKSSQPHCALRYPDRCIRHSQNLHHNYGNTHKHHCRHNKIEQRKYSQYRKKNRLFVFNKSKAIQQIGTYRTKNVFAVGIFFKGNMYENFHNCRENETAYAYKKNGHYPERTEQNAAYYRSQ